MGVYNMYKFHKGCTQSLNQHNKCMAGYLNKKQATRLGSKKATKSFYPKSKKVKLIMQLQNENKALKIKTFILSAKIRKLQQPDILL